MKKSTKYIIITTILISIILIVILMKYKQNSQLKVNEININGTVVQLTASKSDYLEYNYLDDFTVYENSSSFEIEIQNQNIVTYKNIQIGDDASKLDFCNEPIPNIFYYETNYRHKGYHLEICYGVDPFDSSIISITYKYYNK